ncbi:orc4 [Symbiodinium natans]|uniref:Orc4 protein n=1 Tax=Symbiodinium natans TaxID=878477 RepID=A0A812JCD0_9DINO|nr:orc4 [Symbiodinium natans]
MDMEPSDAARADRLMHSWLLRNATKMDQAERLLSARWANPSLFNERMQICEEVLQVMKQVLGLGGTGSANAESKSLLLLGESSSGKTQAVDWCLQRLKEERSNVVALRASGGAYNSNMECLRHLASQVAVHCLTTPPTSCLEGSMEWFRNLLKVSFNHDSAVVIILDQFEKFCAFARQTLLYNLFNLAQEMSIRLCIIGISSQFDVVSKLEKRIHSRFQMHCIYATLPRTPAELLEMLECKLHLPEGSKGLDDDFVKEFNAKVTLALKARLPDWTEQVLSGCKPSWFLWRCLPVAGFLRNSVALDSSCQSSESPQKCPRIGGPLDTLIDSEEHRQEVLLSGLVECEHLVLLALFQQWDRAPKKTRSLSTTLYELKRLVADKGVLSAHTDATLTAAFSRLLEVKLVRLSGSEDVPKIFRPCESVVDRIYKKWVADLPEKATEKQLPSNPLRRLPEDIRIWILRWSRT